MLENNDPKLRQIFPTEVQKENNRRSNDTSIRLQELRQKIELIAERLGVNLDH